MTSASGRIEHAILKIQNFKDFFPDLKPNPADTAITEWDMIVGKAISCQLDKGGGGNAKCIPLEFNTSSFECTIYYFPASYCKQ